MRDYELVLVINPELSEEDVATTVSKLGGFVAARGGAVTGTNRWGKRKLAYPIKHFTEGTYILTRLKLEPQIAAELEGNLRISESVIRHLLVKLET